jgi:hypothetical protein
MFVTSNSWLSCCEHNSYATPRYSSFEVGMDALEAILSSLYCKFLIKPVTLSVNSSESRFGKLSATESKCHGQSQGVAPIRKTKYVLKTIPRRIKISRTFCSSITMMKPVHETVYNLLII